MNHILHSDVMLAQGKGVTHPVGSKRHEAILHSFDRLLATVTRQLNERDAEHRAHPGNPDLARRIGVLVQVVTDTEKRRDHFEKTGEVLQLAGVPADATPRNPSTLYLCPLCKATDDAPGRFLRVDAAPNSPHFGQPVPCPRCRPGEYAGYVAAKGQPNGLPWPDGGVTAVPWKERGAA